MKKIAIIRTCYAEIDTQSYNVQEIGLATGLTQYNVSTDIYSRFSDIKIPVIYSSANNCIIRLIPIYSPAFFGKISFYPKLMTEILKNNYDVVQVHEDSQPMTPYILRMCHKAGIKTVLYQGMYADYLGIKCLYQKIFDCLFTKIIMRCSDIRLAKTQSAKTYLEKKGYFGINILPVGLHLHANPTACSCINKISEFKKKHEKLLLYIGTLTNRRNIQFLLNIINTLHIKHNKNFGLVIIGDGPEKQELLNSIQANNLTEHVLHINHVPNKEVGTIYSLCDLFLLASNYEIYGMVVLEALFFGIPVLSTPTAGPKDILTHPYLGEYINLDLTTWITKILSIISEETPDKKNFRTNYVTDKHQWGKIAMDYTKLVFDDGGKICCDSKNR